MPDDPPPVTGSAGDPRPAAADPAHIHVIRFVAASAFSFIALIHASRGNHGSAALWAAVALGQWVIAVVGVRRARARRHAAAEPAEAEPAARTGRGEAPGSEEE
jgi:hypothetical protein